VLQKKIRPIFDHPDRVTVKATNLHYEGITAALVFLIMLFSRLDRFEKSGHVRYAPNMVELRFPGSRLHVT
jgi:hypothetical protein